MKIKPTKEMIEAFGLVRIIVDMYFAGHKVDEKLVDASTILDNILNKLKEENANKHI